MKLTRRRKILGILSTSNRNKLLEVCRAIMPKTRKKKNVKKSPVISSVMSSSKLTTLSPQATATSPPTSPVPTPATSSKSAVIDNIGKFKLNGMSYLESLKQLDLDQMIIVANDVYYNDKTVGSLLSRGLPPPYDPPDQKGRVGKGTVGSLHRFIGELL